MTSKYQDLRDALAEIDKRRGSGNLSSETIAYMYGSAASEELIRALLEERDELARRELERRPSATDLVAILTGFHRVVH